MQDRLDTLHARLPRLLDAARQVAILFCAYYAYRLLRGLVDDPAGESRAFANARHLVGMEKALHVFYEPAVQQWAEARPAVIDVAVFLYINAQTSVTLGALVFLYLFRNPSFYFVRNMFVVAFAVAIVGYIVFPCAPPRFFNSATDYGFTDSVTNAVGVNTATKATALYNPYAAVPSMHVAFALMVSIPLARLCKWRALRVFWALYPLLVVFVIVSTANHFFTDAVLGAVTAGVSALAARSLARARPAAWAFAPARA